MSAQVRAYANRNVAMIVFVAAIFVLAIVYSVFSATTIGDNVNTGGTLTVSGVSNLGHVYASSTVQATLNGLFYASVGIGSTSPGASLAVNGPGIFVGTSTVFGGLNLESLSATGTLGFYTRGTAASRMVIDSSGNVGIATSGPATTLSAIGSGYFTLGLGVGYATTGSGNLLVNDLAVIRGRLGVNASTSPAVEFGVTGSGLVSAGFGVGYATTGTGNLVVSDLAVFRNRVGVNASTSPAVEFGVTGSGLFSTGLGVGYATTGIGNFIASDLGVFRNRLGVNATTSPYQEFGVAGDAVFGGAVGTSSVSIETTTSARGGCIELRDSDGAWVSIYAGKGGATSTTSHVLATGNQLGAGAGLTAILVVQQGRCETVPD